MITPVNLTTVTVSWSEVQCFNESGGAVAMCSEEEQGRALQCAELQ